MEPSKEMDDDHAKCMPRKPRRGKEKKMPIRPSHTACTSAKGYMVNHPRTRTRKLSL